ncbi:MAG TPA: heme ABC transporter ATP-binding protein [Flavobacteriaceae bacterium]|nr:heme ABC transporter ATP-binding protein [Flavobacteriaceae bacterium]
MITATKIHYSHKKFPILNGVDLEVEYGEFLVIVGPNGAGKSTLLNVLANEINKENNTILFKNKNFKDWNIKELAYNKAKFSQHNSNDIPLFTEDVVMMGRYPYFQSRPTQQDYESVNAMMEEVAISSLKGRNYNTLSGGEKQRTHLARVLVQLDNDIAHKLIFLDEPLNNLDVKHQHRVLETIKKFTQKGNAAVVVLHDLNLAAQFADKVLLMKRGSVEAYGKPKEVFTDKIISTAYNFPCMICPNPFNNKPIIVFGKNEYEMTETV